MALQILSNNTPAEDNSLGRILPKNPNKKIFDPSILTITDIKQAVKNPNRVNIFVNGKYTLSLDIFQLAGANIAVGKVISTQEIDFLQSESTFGKMYARALEYCLMRPHSAREVRDYLYRKSQPKRKKNGEMTEKIAPEISQKVIERLVEKKYINDENFARWWIENRNQRKGISRRKLVAELMQKGIAGSMITQLLLETDRSDGDELEKMIAKKRKRYPDDQKMIAYLMRQGFSYEDSKTALNKELEEE